MFRPSFSLARLFRNNMSQQPLTKAVLDTQQSTPISQSQFKMKLFKQFLQNSTLSVPLEDDNVEQNSDQSDGSESECEFPVVEKRKSKVQSLKNRDGSAFQQQGIKKYGKRYCSHFY